MKYKGGEIFLPFRCLDGRMPKNKLCKKWKSINPSISSRNETGKNGELQIFSVSLSIPISMQGPNQSYRLDPETYTQEQKYTVFQEMFGFKLAARLHGVLSYT